MFPTVRALVLVAFHCWLMSLPLISAPWNFLVTGMWVNRRGESQGISSTLSVRIPFHTPASKLFLHLSICTMMLTSTFQNALISDWGQSARKKMVNSLLVQGCIKLCYPSLIHLLLFTIQSFQIAEPWILLRFYSRIQ